MSGWLILAMFVFGSIAYGFGLLFYDFAKEYEQDMGGYDLRYNPMDYDGPCCIGVYREEHE